jgi:two-component system, NarL family, invasion response regulator UvrY
MKRVLVADDHPVVRQGVRRLLQEGGEPATVGEAEDAAETLRLVREQEWDLILLDISMPGGGLDALKQIRQEKPRLPVLVLSVHPEDQYAVRVLKAGASGYITKDTSPDELKRAIRKVSLGGKFISTALAEKLAAGLEGRAAAGSEHESLSDREYQVLCMIASGKTVSEIGRELELSVKTISTYRARILKKLGLRNNTELARYGIQQHLVE